MRSVTEERVRVRYGETDMMGHAYYGNYMLWFEQARGAWCRARGFGYGDLEAMGFKLPVVEVWAKYRGEIKYDDVIVVRVWVEEQRRTALKFGYEIVREGEDLVLTEGWTWHVWVGAGMRPVAPSSEVREMLSRAAGGS